ncbi:MAG: NADP-dependent oxidoreductase [Candidatus Eremiobacteraeota bacterium]|nr:NADP-dependent oxidoreductase [Candidatus Eremiobacteraeota bacterium]
MNKRVLLARRPEGEPVLDDFRIVEEPIPSPRDGELLIRTQFLSLDPYMRGRMSAAKSYAKPVEVGEVMVGGTVGNVVESKNPKFVPGDVVLAQGGWQGYAVSDGSGVVKLDPKRAPVTYALGILGMPGQTAYCALLDIGRPKAGETVVVSAASGAVGSVAGQIAKIKGCRVVGVAGGEEKCRYVTAELGFDACIDRRTENLSDALKQHCPDGIDVYFDNTAGAILEAVLRRINLHARIPLVGLIEQYNATKEPGGPNLRPLLTNRAKIEGFLFLDHLAHTKQFLADVGGWLREGKLRYREDVVEGLENAPRALIGMLRGENFGKLLVKVS